MKKYLPDFDLDVMNQLADFPTNESDCYLWLRGHIDDKEGHVFSIEYGESDTLVLSITGAMEKIEGFDQLILNSVLTYFDIKSELKEQFIKELSL